jgi:hypothetical protein
MGRNSPGCAFGIPGASARPVGGQLVLYSSYPLDDKTVTIDGNNPLCGREVAFRLAIRLVRDATEEEIAAGGKAEVLN